MSRKKNQPKQPYLETLEHDAKFRYLEKIREIDGIDPYSIPKADWTTNLEEFPPVSWPDLVMYLVFGRNEFTHSMDEFRAYKSLEAYNQFVCGWVRDISMKSLPEKSLSVLSCRVSKNLF